MENPTSKPSAERNEKIQAETRPPLIDNALSEAMIYYAGGQSERGERQLKHALKLADISQQRILPREIAYIVSGGRSTPPEKPQNEDLEQPDLPSENPSVKERIEQSMQEFRDRISNVVAPLKDIQKILEEIADKVLADLEHAAPAPTL